MDKSLIEERKVEFVKNLLKKLHRGANYVLRIFKFCEWSDLKLLRKLKV